MEGTQKSKYCLFVCAVSKMLYVQRFPIACSDSEALHNVHVANKVPITVMVAK